MASDFQTTVSRAELVKIRQVGKNVRAEMVNAIMDDTVNPPAGINTAIVGFQLKDSDGNNLLQSIFAELHLYDDVGLFSFSASAILSTASAGTIVGGSGSPAIKVQTDAKGKFTCMLTNTADASVWVVPDGTSGGPILDTQGSEEVIFTA